MMTPRRVFIEIPRDPALVIEVVRTAACRGEARGPHTSLIFFSTGTVMEGRSKLPLSYVCLWASFFFLLRITVVPSFSPELMRNVVKTNSSFNVTCG